MMQDLQWFTCFSIKYIHSAMIAPGGTVGDGLTSGSHGSRQQQEDVSGSTTEHGTSYMVVWDTSHDLPQSTTTPCAPPKQSGVLAAPCSRTHPKASRILARPARRGSPLQSNKRAPDGREGGSKRMPGSGSCEGVEIEGCMIVVLAAGDTVLMMGLVGTIPQGCRTVSTS